MPLIHFYNFKKDQNYTADGSIVYDKTGNSHYLYQGGFGTSSNIGSTTYGVSNLAEPFSNNAKEAQFLSPYDVGREVCFSVLFRFKLESIAYEKEIIKLTTNKSPELNSISVRFDPTAKLLGIKIGSNNTVIIYNYNNQIIIKAGEWYFAHLVIKTGFYATILLQNQILAPYSSSVVPYLFKDVNVYDGFSANWRVNQADTSKVYLSELAFFNSTIDTETQQNYFLNGIVVPDPPLKNTDIGYLQKYVDYKNPVYDFTFNQNVNYNLAGGGVTATVSSGVITRNYMFIGPGVSNITGSSVPARIDVQTKSPSTYVNKPFAKGTPQKVSGLNSGTNNALLVGENIGNKFVSEIAGYNFANFTSKAVAYDLVGSVAQPNFSWGKYYDYDVTISFSYRKLTDAQSVVSGYDVNIGLLKFNEFEGNFYWILQNSAFVNLATGTISTVKNAYNWNNFCFVLNTEKQKGYVYVNGVLVDIFFHTFYSGNASTNNPTITLGGTGIRLFAIDDLRLYQSALTDYDAKQLLYTLSYIGSAVVSIGDTVNGFQGAGDGKSSAKLKLPNIFFVSGTGRMSVIGRHKETLIIIELTVQEKPKPYYEFDFNNYSSSVPPTIPDTFIRPSSRITDFNISYDPTLFVVGPASESSLWETIKYEALINIIQGKTHEGMLGGTDLSLLIGSPYPGDIKKARLLYPLSERLPRVSKNIKSIDDYYFNFQYYNTTNRVVLSDSQEWQFETDGSLTHHGFYNTQSYTSRVGPSLGLNTFYEPINDYDFNRSYAVSIYVIYSELINKNPWVFGFYYKQVPSYSNMVVQGGLGIEAPVYTEDGNNLSFVDGVTYNTTFTRTKSYYFTFFHVSGPNKSGYSTYKARIYYKTYTKNVRHIYGVDLNGNGFNDVVDDRVFLNNGRSIYSEYTVTLKIDDGNWHGICFAKHDDLGISLYVDGLLKTTLLYPDAEYNAKGIFIDSRRECYFLDFSGTEQFAIDNVQFYKGLTPAEIFRVFANVEYFYGLGKCDLRGSAIAVLQKNEIIGSGTIQLTASSIVVLIPRSRSFKGSGIFQVSVNALIRSPYQYPIHKYRFDEAAQSENNNRLSDDVGDNDFTTIIDTNDEGAFFLNAKIGTGLVLGTKYKNITGLYSKKWFVYGQIRDIDWTGIQEFTISFYLKADLSSGADFSFQGSWFRMYNYAQKDSTLSLEFGNNTKFWQTNNQFKGSSFSSSTAWSFFTITFDSNYTVNGIKVGQYKTYVNGALSGTFFSTIPFRSPFNSVVEFGYGGTDAQKPAELPPTKFLLDDLRIYAAVLSQKQIIDLYICKHGPLIGHGSAEFAGSATYFVGGREKGNGQFEISGTTEVYNTKQYISSKIGLAVSSEDAQVFINKYLYEGTGVFENNGSAEAFLATYAEIGSGIFQIDSLTSASINQWRYLASFSFELTGTAKNEVVYGTEFVYPVHAFTFNNPQVDVLNSSKIYFTDKLSAQKFQIEIKSEKTNKDMYGQNIPYSIDYNTTGKFTNKAITVGSLSVSRFQYYGTPSNRYQRYDKYFTVVGSIDKNLSQLINGSVNWTISFWVKKNTISIPSYQQSVAFPISSYLCNGYELDVPAVFRVKSDANFHSYGNWTHICYVFNVSLIKDDRNYISYYINGIVQPTIPYQNITDIIQDFITFGTDIPQTAASFVDSDGITQTITKNFGPQPYAIDDVRFYNKSLSTINIQRIINSIYVVVAAASQFELSGSSNVVVLPNSFTGSGSFQVVANSNANISVYEFQGSGYFQTFVSHKFKVPYSYPVHKFVFEEEDLLIDSVGQATVNYTVSSIVNGESATANGKTGKALYFGTTGKHDKFNILEYNISASIVNLNIAFQYYTISFWISGTKISTIYNSSNPIIELVSDSVKSVTISDEAGGTIYFWYVIGDSLRYLTHYSFPNSQNYSLITLTYDDTVMYGQDDSQLGEWKVYFDAVLVRVLRTPETNSYFIPPHSGASMINLSSYSAPSKRRAIDDLRLYDKVLFEYEILDIYNFKYGPIFGDSDFQMTGSSPVKLNSIVIVSGVFELTGSSNYLINVYEHIADGAFEILGAASYYSSFYEYLASGSFENFGESGYYSSNYVYSGTGQFENSGSAQAAQDKFEIIGSGNFQTIADSVHDLKISIISDGKFEITGSYDHYVIYKYIVEGSFETYGVVPAKIKLSFAATGSVQVVSDYSYYPIYGNLWERTSHYYQFNKNMFDGRGNFNILFDGTYATNSSVGKYGIGMVLYPFDATGSEDDAFFSGERFALTFRFSITDINYDKVLITLNSNDPVATIVEPSITIVFEKEDKKLHFGFGGDILSNVVITQGSWYFVCLYKNQETIYTSINNGNLIENLYDYPSVNFNGIQSQNLENGFDKTPLHYSDIRFYKDIITKSEITYLYNGGIPTVLSPVDVAYEYELPDHKYEFLLSERVSSCCYELTDSSGDAAITLDVSELAFEPFIDGIDGNAIRIGKNYLNQGGLYLYEAYGYAYDDLVGTESYSVAFWHKMLGPSVGIVDPTNNLPFSETVAITTLTGEVIFSIKESNGELRFYLENTFLDENEYLLAAGVETQQWNYIAFVCDSSQGRAYVYFNSNLVKAFPYSRVLTEAAALFLGYNSYANNLNLGVMSVASQSYSELQAIDQLLFFTEPITAWDVYTLYGCGIESNIELNLEIPFNTGTLPTYTYRFEASCGAYDDQSKIVPAQTLGESCSYTTFVNVGADTITNACSQLLDAGYDFEITSVKRWSKPTVFEAGPFQDGVYEDITNYCNDPACFQFCVNYRVNVAVTAIMFAITDEDVILGSGLFNLDGTAGIRFNKFTVTGDGLFEIYGEAPASQIGGSEGQYYTGSGSFESFGSADYDSSDKGIINTDVSADIIIVNLQPFVVATSGATLVGSQGSSSVSQCGCLSIPYETAFSHNLTKESEFTNFIKRNNFTIPDKIVFYYNEKISKYVGNLKYNGLSTSSNNLEKWEIVFELACTGYYNEFSNLYDWNFAISFKKTPINSNSVDTKVVLLFKSSHICPLNGISFDFRAEANLNTKLLTVNGNTFLANSVIVNDRIGLFKSTAWTNNPVLTLQVGTPL